MRKCKCSGNCGSRNDGVSRREFLALVGAGTAATFLADSAWGLELPSDEWESWKRSLFQPCSPRLYLSEKHLDARMHLGGIGTGNVEIGADGQLTAWQLFNTLRDGQIPLHFAIKTGAAAKLLQTAGGPDWPRVKRIEMTGEYPLAALRYCDEDLPVKLELTAFTPFAPLDTQLSSVPLAVFRFRIKNPTAQAQIVSLAAMFANPVGYDATGRMEGNSCAGFGGNVNEFFREGQAKGVFLRAIAGKEARLDRPVFIYAMANLKELKSPPLDRPENLKIEILEQSLPALADSAHAVLWLEEPSQSLSVPFLRAARDAVEAGATLVFSGKSMPLLKVYAAATGGKPVSEASRRTDILFEDFEKGYERWTVEGEAFGKQPAHGTLPSQQVVAGYVEKGFVDSFVGGDDAMGKLTSKAFTIERRFINFLVGGGNSENTQLRLFVRGKVVRAASGRNNERLESGSWDVGEFGGQSAHLEIVDAQTGGWGHINVDQITFSDQPANWAVLAFLEELLPARFSAIREEAGRVWFENQELLPGVKQDSSGSGLPMLIRQIGLGKVVLAAGPVLEPGQAAAREPRQRAFSMLCALAGANYAMAGGQSARAPGFGTLALATLGPKVTGLSSFEDWAAAWSQFSGQGRFERLKMARSPHPTPPGKTTNCALATTVSVPAGGTVEIPFLFAWHYPNKYNPSGVWMGCHYATRWPQARAVLRDAVANYAAWSEKTQQFHDAFYDSTLPYWMLDCMTANAAIFRHIGVVFRIANGDIYGWEGSNGCCDPTCTHVWGYEQSLAHLFPDLEKDMRRIDFKHQQRPDGGVNNRTDVPSPPHPTGEAPFADGHASCILKAFREALNSSDESFFNDYWPHIKSAVNYLIDRDAKACGGQPSGTLQDDQFNTYDEALHGVTSFISGYYLAALRAGEEWARRVGEDETAKRFHQIFEAGQKKVIELCWNGEYFQQNLPDYMNHRGEVGPGCMADQLIGQWWMHQLGLGYILPREMVVSSLRAIFKYNFKSDLTGWKHAPRAFAGVKDKGLIICTWPKGGRPPNVMLYSDEVWTGVEYQVAAHMIYEGLLEEGFAIVKGARDRYDGVPRSPIARNPWSEIECGGHYARAMSSWSLLLALSGYEYDGPHGILRFAPRYEAGNFKGFFSGPEGWGSFAQKAESGAQRVNIAIQSGKLRVKTLRLELVNNIKPAKLSVLVGNITCPSTFQTKDGAVEIQFGEQMIILNQNEGMEITLS